MKKYFLTFLMTGVLTLNSCCHKSQHVTEQGLQQKPAKIIMTGWLTPKQISNQINAYQSGKNQYQPNEESIKKLKSVTADLQIIVFLGTWCSDSEREVPRFLNVMELTNNSHITFRLFGLDHTKRDPDGFAEKYQIEFVPTFIVLHNNEEIGRIVETPTVSLEQDLVEIIALVLE
jgi:thiol-disulfide isomerase/thioredoxin